VAVIRQMTPQSTSLCAWEELGVHVLKAQGLKRRSWGPWPCNTQGTRGGIWQTDKQKERNNISVGRYSKTDTLKLGRRMYTYRNLTITNAVHSHIRCLRCILMINETRAQFWQQVPPDVTSDSQGW